MDGNRRVKTNRDKQKSCTEKALKWKRRTESKGGGKVRREERKIIASCSGTKMGKRKGKRGGNWIGKGRLKTNRDNRKHAQRRL